MHATIDHPAADAPPRAKPMHQLRVAARIAVTELRLFLRDPWTLVGLLAFPAVTVLVLAGVFGSTPDPEFAGVRPSEHYVVRLGVLRPPRPTRYRLRHIQCREDVQAPIQCPRQDSNLWPTD